MAVQTEAIVSDGGISSSSSADHPPDHQGNSNGEPRPQSVYRLTHAFRESSLKLDEIELTRPLLFKAIKDTPWALVHHWSDGLSIAWPVWSGIKRHGPEYIYTYIKENHIELPGDSSFIVSMLHGVLGFVTYDKAEQYLPAHGAEFLIRNITVKNLDEVPKYTEEEEEQIRLEREDAERRKKAEEENERRLDALKKELDSIQFSIAHLERSIEYLKKSGKPVAHLEKSLEVLRSREAHVKDAINNWHRDAGGRPAV